MPCRGMLARTGGSPGEAGLATGQSLSSPPGADPGLRARAVQLSADATETPAPAAPAAAATPGGRLAALRLSPRGFVPAGLRGRPCLPPPRRLPALPPAAPRSRSPRVPVPAPQGCSPHGLVPSPGEMVSISTPMATPARLSPARRRGRTPSAGSAPGQGRPAARQRPQPMRGRGGEDGQGRGGVRPPRSERPGAAGTRGALRRGCPPPASLPQPRPCGGCCCHPPGRARFSGGARRSAPPGVSPAFAPRVPVRGPIGGGPGAWAGEGGTGGDAAGAPGTQGNQAPRFRPSRQQDAAECERRVGISRHKEPRRKASVLTHYVCALKGMSPRFCW